MKNQFFYTRKDYLPLEEGSTEPKFKEYIDSFNIDKVIRTMSMEDGRRLVLIDDLHERVAQVPDITPKGKMVGYKKERNTYQSEIYLEPEDSDRFLSLFDEFNESCDSIDTKL
jgi:Tol biopolymer transport system component